MEAIPVGVENWNSQPTGRFVGCAGAVLTPLLGPARNASPYFPAVVILTARSRFSFFSIK
jgi:hypothetical protein